MEFTPPPIVPFWDLMRDWQNNTCSLVPVAGSPGQLDSGRRERGGGVAGAGSLGSERILRRFYSAFPGGPDIVVTIQNAHPNDYILTPDLPPGRKELPWKFKGPVEKPQATHVPEGTVADIYIYIYIYVFLCVCV